MHNQRVDAPPDIVDDGVARDVDPAGLGIDLDLAHSTTIGKDRIVHFIVGDDRKLALQTEARRLLRQLEKVGAWSYATVWRVAARAGIELTAGREAKGYKRLPPEQWAKVEDAVRKHPGATQLELARQCGVSRSTVGRVVRARRAAPALAG
jgi:hypothetical protein